MIKNKLRSGIGVSLISLSITVIIILIITSTLIHNLKDNLKIEKLRKLQNDISNLSEKVEAYYSRNGAIPKASEYIYKENLENSGILGAMDTGNFYIIDLSAIENLTLNYGKDYEKWKLDNSIDVSTLQDIYIINENSHNIFYVQGISVDNEIFYTNYTKDDVDKAEVNSANREQLWTPKYDVNGIYKDKNENTVTVPEGFQVSLTEGENTVEDGLVITDGTSEFVWVPVPDVIWDGVTEPSQTYTPMATTEDAKDGYYRGMLYDFEGSTSIYQASYKPETTNYREPDILEDSTHGDASTGDASTGDVKGLDLLNSIVGIQGTIGTDNETMLNTWRNQLLKEYKKMVESVNKYKGFYVGRYETGMLIDGNIVSKNASTDTNVTTLDATGSKGDTWYGLYQKQKEYADGKNGIKSTMIWGSQYDAMMNWMAKQGKTVGTADENKWNSSQVTGDKAEDNINNIFDLYGCHREWSIEANKTNTRVNRGGNYNNSFAPSHRGHNYPYRISTYYGSRLTLFIQ